MSNVAASQTVPIKAETEAALLQRLPDVWCLHDALGILPNRRGTHGYTRFTCPVHQVHPVKLMGNNASTFALQYRENPIINPGGDKNLHQGILGNPPFRCRLFPHPQDLTTPLASCGRSYRINRLFGTALTASDCVSMSGLTSHTLTGIARMPPVRATEPLSIALIIATQYE